MSFLATAIGGTVSIISGVVQSNDEKAAARAAGGGGGELVKGRGKLVKEPFDNASTPSSR